MVSSRSSGVNVSPVKSVATSRAVVSDSDVARDGDAISPNSRQSNRAAEDRRHMNGASGTHEWSQSGPPSLSMHGSLQHLDDLNLQNSGQHSECNEGAVAPTAIAAAASCTVKVTGSRDEENYEAFGSVDGDVDDGADSPDGSSSTPSPTGTSSLRNSRSPNSTIGRHSWLRTSLRRTPPCAGKKRLSSNALASQLYRSGSFNSSGRGSTCDPTDDMYSDVSLEEDVIIDLSHRNLPNQRTAGGNHPGTFKFPSQAGHQQPYPYYPSPCPHCNPYQYYAPCHPGAMHSPPPWNTVDHEPNGWTRTTFITLAILALAIIVFAIFRSLSPETRSRICTILAKLLPFYQVQMIQEQMDAFVDTQSVGEERYARVKQENATLQARILMLEEAAKDAETRTEERLQAEQRRHKEWASRLERERQLQLENYAIKVQALEQEGSTTRDEVVRLRDQFEKIKIEKNRLENDLEDARRDADAARESERLAISRANEAHYELEAAREELALRAEDQQRIEELMQQVAQLRAHNKSLEESRDELQAAAALQAGRELLIRSSCNNTGEKGPSLAAELLAGMNQEQIDGQIAGDYSDLCSLTELKHALKEQQEVNAQLRTYIDGILLNIVENYPQLLEVKQTH